MLWRYVKRRGMKNRMLNEKRGKLRTSNSTYSRKRNSINRCCTTYSRLSRFTCLYSYISNGSQGLSIPPAPQRLKRPMRMASLRKAVCACSPYSTQKHTPDAMLKGPSYKRHVLEETHMQGLECLPTCPRV